MTILHQLQPIDGSYFATTYFWVTTAVAVIVAFLAVLLGDRDDR